MSLEERFIDLTKVSPEELLFKKVQGGSLSIQVDGEASITLMGKHSELETFYNVGVINLTTLGKQSSITGAGIYFCAVTGMDLVKLEATGTGKVHIKVLGD